MEFELQNKMLPEKTSEETMYKNKERLAEVAWNDCLPQYALSESKVMWDLFCLRDA